MCQILWDILNRKHETSNNFLPIIILLLIIIMTLPLVETRLVEKGSYIKLIWYTIRLTYLKFIITFELSTIGV